MTRYRQYDIAEIEALFLRVEALEARVAALDGRPSPAPAETAGEGAAGSDLQIAELARQGELIEAIKLYRERTGVGLAEAKAVVEEMARRI
jgi:large subunit ribosomal protein L7/L12